MAGGESGDGGKKGKEKKKNLGGGHDGRSGGLWREVGNEGTYRTSERPAPEVEDQRRAYKVKVNPALLTFVVTNCSVALCLPSQRASHALRLSQT
jgi:hypothetical protein